MFHSKISGKKKLCLDAQTINETKSYSHEYTYSFKIDKNYFNLIQVASDKYEIRVDNRSFQTLMQEDKIKAKEEISPPKTKKVEKDRKSSFEEFDVPNNPNKSPNFKQPSFKNFDFPNNLRSSQSRVNPRNSGTNFFSDKDFDFSENSNNDSIKETQNRSMTPNVVKNNFSDINNNFSTGGNKTNNVTTIPKKNEGLLVDMNDIYEKQEKTNNAAVDSNNILSQINFSVDNYPLSSETMKHNQNIFNNLNIEDNSNQKGNTFGFLDTGVNNNNNNNNLNSNNFNNFNNTFSNNNNVITNNTLGSNNNLLEKRYSNNNMLISNSINNNPMTDINIGGVVNKGSSSQNDLKVIYYNNISEKNIRFETR
jgi:hypothetical protein